MKAISGCYYAEKCNLKLDEKDNISADDVCRTLNEAIARAKFLRAESIYKCIHSDNGQLKLVKLKGVL